MLIALALIHFVIAGLLMVYVNGAGLKPWRHSVNAHWTERARLIFQVRDTAKIFRFLLTFLLPSIWYQHDHSSLQWLLDASAVYLGAVFGSYPHLREIQPRTSFKMWLFSIFLNALYTAYFFGGILACSLFMPPLPEWNWLIVVAVFFALLNPVPGKILSFLSFRGGFRKPANERLLRLVHTAAASVGVTPPTVSQLAWPDPWIHFDVNRSELTVSDQLLLDFLDEEIVALCTRELGENSAWKWSWLENFLRHCALFPLLFIIPINHYIPGLGLWMVVVSILLLVLIGRLKKSMNAKSIGIQAPAVQPAPHPVYVRAQEKIYRENLTPVIGGKGPGPDLYQQMLQAGMTPAYPAPAAPSSKFTPVAKFTLLGLIVLNICAATGYPKIEVHVGNDTTSITNQITNTN